MFDFSPFNALISQMKESGSSPDEPLHAVSYRLPRSTFAKVEALSRLTSTSRNSVVIQLLNAACDQLIDAADLPPDGPVHSDEFLAWAQVREQGCVSSGLARRILTEWRVVEDELKSTDTATKGEEA
jgi:hypothetical protein